MRHRAQATPSTLRDFQPHALAIQETPPPPFARWILWIVASLLLIAILWAYFSRLPIMTTAPGKFVPQAHTQVIQSFDTGVVAAVLVHPGDTVEKGQELVRLNPEVNHSALKAETDMLALTSVEQKRLEAELSGNPVALNASAATPAMLNLERSLEQSSLAHQKAEIADDQAQVREAQNSLAAGEAILAEYVQRTHTDMHLAMIAAPLVSEGALSGSHYDQLHDQAARDQGKKASQRKQDQQLTDALTAARDQLYKAKEKYRKSVLQKMETAVNDSYDLTKKKAQAAEQYQMDWLRAPVDGTVQSLSVASIGSVIQAGQTVATVIPGDTPLVLEADLPSQDIGFVKVGQKTQIKVTAYPFEQYGEIPGTVVWISPNAQTSNSLQELPAGENHQPTPPSSATAAKSGTNQTKPTSPPTLYYRIRVQPERTWLRIDGKKQAMGPGMTATVDIRTGDRTVLDFFLDPIVKYANNGLSIR
ncbi:HlyD family type I secretion periplasmic adaptor subunit [Acidithiobacillus ferriphilus]|uniref:HlyD family type I secretion periplasmic adaptor subunit n=1 Tax=Acidithiobacillus ferriphilus TaxID=1689834 RepID=UPI0023313039|nr:HlyD family type I secretion periplasmic adaptor subunit [Acidithiobacillus ferriphilus]WCE95240.1 HlyD family type I secretion periplasmic adaptor subunit [Acidithiobacillus ferriphilus]